MRHTKGPWRFEGEEALQATLNNGRSADIVMVRIVGPEEQIIFIGTSPGTDGLDTMLANAQLMKTSPELLKALKHALDRLNDIPHDYAETNFELIQRTINRAEGRIK